MGGVAHMFGGQDGGSGQVRGYGGCRWAGTITNKVMSRARIMDIRTQASLADTRAQHLPLRTSRRPRHPTTGRRRRRPPSTPPPPSHPPSQPYSAAPEQASYSAQQPGLGSAQHAQYPPPYGQSPGQPPLYASLLASAVRTDPTLPPDADQPGRLTAAPHIRASRPSTGLLNTPNIRNIPIIRNTRNISNPSPTAAQTSTSTLLHHRASRTENNSRMAARHL